MSTLPPPPMQTSLIELDPKDPLRRAPFYMSKAWLVWLLNSLLPPVERGAQILKSIALTSQTASIGTTPMPLGVLASGTYRISTYARVTVAAGTSSSLSVTLRWTDSGVACTSTGASMAGNTIATTLSENRLITIDAASAISYATTYASNAAAAMTYKLLFVVEFLL